MPKKSSPPIIQQTAIGDGNVQVAGNNNTVNVNQTFIQKVSNLFTGDIEQQRALRNRRAMLELVKNTWIKGVLEKSLYHEVLINLNMEERLSAVEHPWDMQLQLPNNDNRILPSGTSIMDVFDEMNGALLILGGPGSGKTTMMLELAHGCIARAEQDETQPIPIVLNLSSWANPKLSISDWVIKELSDKYFASTELAQSWVKHDDLLLLLDGLDEVRMEYRDLCVQALNGFRSQHGSTCLVVCSRIVDYEVLNTRLHLWGAVLLQPLTLSQTDDYFAQIGSQLSEVRQRLKHDAILQELVQQPLMLSVVTLAYQGASAEIFAYEKTEKIDDRRNHIFETYVAKMFERAARSKNEIYPIEQTKSWLAWLAFQMTKHRQSIFYLEQLRHDWLTTFQQTLFMVLIALAFGYMGGLIISGGNFIGPVICIPVSLFMGLVLSRLIISGQNYVAGGRINVLRWSWRRATRGLILGSVIGLVVGLMYLLINQSAYILFLYKLPDISVRNEFGNLLLPEKLRYIIPGIMAWSGGFGLIGVLLYGFVKDELRLMVFPNQGVRRSIQSMFFVWSAIMLVFGFMFHLLVIAVPFTTGFMLDDSKQLLFSSIYEYLQFQQDSVIYISTRGLMFGTIVGLPFGLFYGGYLVINHYLIRLFLFITGCMPLNYVNFLEFAAERIFLRRVGGGYIFVHRLLMEHFADMHTADEK